jgi:6-phosphogluconate dehydrogenase
LNRIKQAYDRDRKLKNLLLDPWFADLIGKAQTGLRSVVAGAARHGIAAPALASALAYFDGYRSARLPASLLQAQRDYFGAHTYERVDRPGSVHSDWTSL